MSAAAQPILLTDPRPVVPYGSPAMAADPGAGSVSHVGCSVIWLDMPGYAKADVSRQIVMREALNAVLASALETVPGDERIVLDTETGAAVCFLSGPAVAVRAVSVLLRATAAEGPSAGPVLRLGLDHGPVALTQPAQGEPALVGDGAVVAERLSAFATDGQAIASRAFALRAAPDIRLQERIFRPLGARTDAHLRSHELFELRPDAPGAVDGPASAPPAETTRGTVWTDHRAASLAVAASVLVLLAVAAARFGGNSTDETGPAAATRQVTAVTPSSPTPAEPPVPVAPPGAGTADAADAQPASPPQTTRTVIREGKRPAPANADRKRQSGDAPAPAAAPQEKVQIALAVSPWGEVLVNGVNIGVSPPLTTVEVPAGRVTVEIRNPGFPSHVETLEASAGQPLRIKHKF